MANNTGKTLLNELFSDVTVNRKLDKIIENTLHLRAVTTITDGSTLSFFKFTLSRSNEIDRDFNVFAD
jgi:hypothetical protein